MTTRITRRTALKSAAAAAIAAPFIVRSSVLGQDAPSNTLRLAAIGTGRMGHGDMQQALHQGLSPKLNARIVAVCDLDSIRAQHAKEVCEKAYTQKLGEGKFEPIKVYGDYRELLARKDVDGVTISTSEHWHALIAIAAAKAGKDSYVQKPLTYTINEGKALVKAVRDNKRILQTGSQQRSEVYFRMACELVRNGRLGKLQEIEVVLPTDSGKGNKDTMPVPENLNYKMWLGPAPDAPYTEHRVHPQKGYGRPGWLQIEQYCLGMITGWGAHMYDICQWGHGDGACELTEMQAKAEFPDRGLFDVHTKFEAEGSYADGVRIKAHSGNAGVRFTGEKGWIWVQRGSIKAENPAVLKEKIKDDEIKLYVSTNHMANFLECMRTRKDPAAPVEAGHRANTLCCITHIAMKLGRKLKWDPAKEQFIGDDEANKRLDYEHRDPWKIA